MCLFAALMVGNLQGQYQKMSNSSSLDLSGFESYLSAGWSKQISHKYTFTLNGFYFQDEDDLFTTDNFGGNLGFSRWLLRFGNAYVSGGGGGFLAHTNAESAAGTEADDLTFGLDLRAEVEYYVAWWFVVYGEVKQYVFFGSDFFNSKVVGGGGVKFVF